MLASGRELSGPKRAWRRAAWRCTCPCEIFFKCRHPAMAKWQNFGCLWPFPPARCSCAIALFLHGHLTAVFWCIARWQIAPQKLPQKLQRLSARRTHMRLVRLLFATAFAMAPQKNFFFFWLNEKNQKALCPGFEHLTQCYEV